MGNHGKFSEKERSAISNHGVNLREKSVVRCEVVTHMLQHINILTSM
jgi:hypothetical protein